MDEFKLLESTTEPEDPVPAVFGWISPNTRSRTLPTARYTSSISPNQEKFTQGTPFVPPTEAPSYGRRSRGHVCSTLNLLSCMMLMRLCQNASTLASSDKKLCTAPITVSHSSGSDTSSGRYSSSSLNRLRSTVGPGLPAPGALVLRTRASISAAPFTGASSRDKQRISQRGTQPESTVEKPSSRACSTPSACSRTFSNSFRASLRITSHTDVGVDSPGRSSVRGRGLHCCCRH